MNTDSDTDMHMDMDQAAETDRKITRTYGTQTESSHRRPQNIFQMCSDVLDQYPDVSKEQMSQRRKAMRDEYKGTKVVDYNSEITHCAYIRTDVTFHACALTKMIDRTYWKRRRDFQRLFSFAKNSERVLTIASIGCGPGTDMLGVLWFLDKMCRLNDLPFFRFEDEKHGFDHDDLPFIHLALFDLNPGWRKAVDHFKDAIRKNVKENVGNSFKTSFVPWSLTQDPEARVIQPSLKVADFFIFSWILSDVLRGSASDLPRANRVKDNLNKIGAEAKCGAYFMFLDTNTHLFSLENVLRDTLFALPYFDLVHSESKNYQLGPEEQAKDLGNYYDENEQPKLNIPVVMRVYQKIVPNEEW